MPNTNQLSTIEQARALVAELNARNIGGGVLPEFNSGTPAAPDFRNERSGIFLLPWLPGPGNFPEPRFGDALPYLLKFNNGAGGNNVGLILDKLRRYPTSPEYVYGEIAKEVNAMASNALEG